MVLEGSFGLVVTPSSSTWGFLVVLRRLLVLHRLGVLLLERHHGQASCWLQASSWLQASCWLLERRFLQHCLGHASELGRIRRLALAGCHGCRVVRSRGGPKSLCFARPKASCISLLGTHILWQGLRFLVFRIMVLWGFCSFAQRGLASPGEPTPNPNSPQPRNSRNLTTLAWILYLKASNPEPPTPKTKKDFRVLRFSVFGDCKQKCETMEAKTVKRATPKQYWRAPKLFVNP